MVEPLRILQVGLSHQGLLGSQKPSFLLFWIVLPILFQQRLPLIPTFGFLVFLCLRGMAAAAGFETCGLHGAARCGRGMLWLFHRVSLGPLRHVRLLLRHRPHVVLLGRHPGRSVRTDAADPRRRAWSVTYGNPSAVEGGRALPRGRTYRSPERNRSTRLRRAAHSRATPASRDRASMRRRSKRRR